MDNMYIMESKFGSHYLIDIKNKSSLELNNGTIENNSGSHPIFHVGSNGTLHLNEMVICKNTQFKEDMPSCIKCKEGGNINITKSNFLDHTSQEYPYSAFLIETKGNLNIKSTKFEDNKSNIGGFRLIDVII